MKRVLFVDEDPALLAALRIRMHALRDRWEARFAPGFASAIELAVAMPFDAVVTELSLAGPGGALLLAEFAQRWPQTTRIVLSGDSDERHATEIVTLAHQFLYKPCAPGALESALEVTAGLQQAIVQPGVRALVGRMTRLPAPPVTFMRLSRLLDDPDVPLAEISRLISSDMSLAARVVQLANSAFFTVPRKVNRIDHAVAHLGTAVLRNLVLMVEVFSAPRMCIAGVAVEPNVLQAHALAVAAVARALSPQHVDREEAFLAGMLHDMGHLVLMQQCEQAVAEAAQLARRERLPAHLAERRVLGASHAEIGAYVLGLWGLPPAIVAAVRGHHDYGIREWYGLGEVVALADVMVQDAVPSAVPWEPLQEPVTPVLLEAFRCPLVLQTARDLTRRTLDSLGAPDA